jgi:hypothetical protein
MDLRAGLIRKIWPPTRIGPRNDQQHIVSRYTDWVIPATARFPVGSRHFRVELYYKIRLLKKLTDFMSVKYVEKQHMHLIKLGE